MGLDCKRGTAWVDQPEGRRGYWGLKRIEVHYIYTYIYMKIARDNPPNTEMGGLRETMGANLSKAHCTHQCHCHNEPPMLLTCL
jgi:hypothetical protein